jgi:prophage antirepressor-like protein
MKNKSIKNDIVIYQAKSGAIELKGDFAKETIWATQAQLVDIFEIDQSVASRHISNIFNDGEISKESNMQKMHNANSDKPVILYSLDVILAVGYRANSARAIRFRKWATQVLRNHLINGYTINRSRIAKNYGKFLKAVEQIKQLLPESGNVSTDSALDLVSLFASTWISLEAYDTSVLPVAGATQKQVSLTAQNLESVLREFKHELMKRKQASELFGRERQADSFTSIVGNVFQSFGGRDVYPSAEEKAAHLLYFVVKDHPFTDGNKRNGAFVFIWILKKARLLNVGRLTPEALTSLTLLVAESDPKNKDRVIGLILLLLKK